MGHHLSKVPSGFQDGVEHESSCTVSHMMSNAFDSQADRYSKYVLKHLVYTITFFGFFFLLSWCYGGSDLERGWDPIEAANEERDAAIEQRDDAQRTWQKTESKYEKTLATNLALRSKIEQDSKDIPLLKQRLSELVEETNTQKGVIESLEAIKRKYDRLSKQVNDYGLSNERPEHQKRYEEAKRNLDITSNSLQNSQSYAKGLKEKLQTQLEKSNAEIKWLRARLRRNARSTGYADDPGFKPGVRCACTEPDIGSLRDQGPKIIELEEELIAKDRNATTTVSELGQHKAMVEGLRNDIARKNVKIGELEGANLEMTKEADVAAAENIRLLTVANTDLNELRAKNAEYKEQTETQTAKIGEWEAAGREFDARVEAKDHRIVVLERQINEQSETHTTKVGEVESQNRSYNDAIYIKDKDYKELYEHCNLVLGEKNDAVDKYKTLTKHVRVLQSQLADSRTKLQQAKNQTSPLQEMQLKEREAAVKAKEDALKKSTDPMENDQQVSKSGGLEMEDVERRLAAANQEIYNAKNRNRAISSQLSTERKERSEEKARYEKVLKQEQQNAKTKCDVLRISLEKEHPLKRVVSKLQDEVIRLRGEAEKRR